MVQVKVGAAKRRWRWGLLQASASKSSRDNCVSHGSKHLLTVVLVDCAGNERVQAVTMERVDVLRLDIVAGLLEVILIGGVVQVLAELAIILKEVHQRALFDLVLKQIALVQEKDEGSGF